MSFLKTKDLEKLIIEKRCIHPWDPKSLKNSSYELKLGDQIFQTDSSSGKRDLLDDKNCQVLIEPGQFALLLTHETVNIPLDRIAFISIKFKEKKKGLVNISGFHVDPGFKGKIKFSVYNAGPNTIVLDKGQNVFVIWLSELTGDSEPYDGDHQNQTCLKSSDIEPLKGTLASPNALLKKIQENEDRLRNIKYGLAILVTLTITAIGKIFADHDSFTKGVEYGRKEAKIDTLVKNSVRIYPTDSLSLYKLDSIITQRIKILNAKKE